MTTDYRRIALFVFVVYVSLIAQNEAAQLEGEAIVGGDYSKDYKYKYQVSIQLEDFHMCGGAIIDNQYILTAAHCVIDEQNRFTQSQLVIVAGGLESNSTDSSVVKVKIEQAYIPRVYRHVKADGPGPERTVGDIAVLKLKNGLGLRNNDKLGKVNLPSKVGGQYLTYDNVVGVVTGYGDCWIEMGKDPQTGDPKEIASGGDLRLKYAEVNIIDQTKCNEKFSKPVTATHICGAVKQRDPKIPEGICTGDSGGPLVYNGDTIIGIASTSPKGCKEDEQPAVYTRVSAYVDFIEKAMKNLLSNGARIGEWKQTEVAGKIAFREC